MNQQTEKQLPPMPEGYMKSGTYTVEYFDSEGEHTGAEYGLSERAAKLIARGLVAEGYHNLGGHSSHIRQSVEYGRDLDSYRTEVELTGYLNGSDFYAEADWRWTHGF